jgi:predicted RecA/RadA family phage recombinase
VVAHQGRDRIVGVVHDDSFGIRSAILRLPKKGADPFRHGNVPGLEVFLFKNLNAEFKIFCNVLLSNETEQHAACRQSCNNFSVNFLSEYYLKFMHLRKI